jgi:tryptophanyl-tRNA synthetase
VFAFHKVFSLDEVDEIESSCRAGTIGCVACKRKLQERLAAFHQPIHEKRTRLLQNKNNLRELIAAGSAKAQARARETLSEVRSAMHIGI